MKLSGASKIAILFVLAAVLTAGSPAWAAVSGQRLWAKRYTYSPGQADRPAGVAVDPSGNVIVTGSSEIASVEDFLTVKYDAAGRRKWARRYDSGGAEDIATHIAVDAGGNIYVTGKSWLVNRSKNDYVTIKYDANGNKLWLRRYNGPASGNDVPAGIKVDISGNVYVTGTSSGFRSGALDSDDDFLTIKYGPSGALKWTRRFTGVAGGQEGAAGLALDPSGNIFVGGFSYNSAGNADYLVVKYNPTGTRKWAKRYDGYVQGHDLPKAIGVDSAGSAYITGKVPENSNDYPPTNIVTVKFDAAGARKWVQEIGVDGQDDEPTGLAIDRSRNIFVCGYVKPTNNSDFLLVKYGPGGAEKWNRTVDMSQPGQAVDDVATAVVTDPAGNAYITGHSTFGNTDFLTGKFDPAGNALWGDFYDGPGGNTDWPFSIAVDPARGAVYVAGESYGGAATGVDFATIKYTR